MLCFYDNEVEQNLKSTPETTLTKRAQKYVQSSHIDVHNSTEKQCNIVNAAEKYEKKTRSGFYTFSFLLAGSAVFL